MHLRTGPVVFSRTMKQKDADYVVGEVKLCRGLYLRLRVTGRCVFGEAREWLMSPEEPGSLFCVLFPLFFLMTRLHKAPLSLHQFKHTLVTFIHYLFFANQSVSFVVFRDLPLR